MSYALQYKLTVALKLSSRPATCEFLGFFLYSFNLGSKKSLSVICVCPYSSHACGNHICDIDCNADLHCKPFQYRERYTSKTCRHRSISWEERFFDLSRATWR